MFYLLDLKLTTPILFFNKSSLFLTISLPSFHSALKPPTPLLKQHYSKRKRKWRESYIRKSVVFIMYDKSPDYAILHLLSLSVFHHWQKMRNDSYLPYLTGFVRVKWDIVVTTCLENSKWFIFKMIMIGNFKLNCNTCKTVLSYFLTNTCLIKWLFFCTFSNSNKDTNSFKVSTIQAFDCNRKFLKYKTPKPITWALIRLYFYPKM